MKKIFLYGASTLLLLSSCGNAKITISKIESFLLDARNGFEVKSQSREIVSNSSTGELLFENETNYHYIFDSLDGGRVNQTIEFLDGGEKQKAEISYKRNSDGYIAKEYINYKNEVDEYIVIDSEGMSSNFDHYFANPFSFIFEEDLVQDEKDANLYHLNPRKNCKFEYFLEGKGVPTKSVDFLFNDEGLEKIVMLSETITGKAYDSKKGEYVPGSWYYEDVLNISEVGTATVNPPIRSESNGLESELSEILNKVNDNYTLTLSLSVKGVPASDETTQVVYFDGSSCYVDNNKAQDGFDGNLLYKINEFKDDGLLYEYEFSESGEWVLTANDNSASYNISPKDKNYFIPHVKEISPSLFEKGSNGEYICANETASPFIGEGFFSDFNATPFFSFGYGLGVELTYNNSKNEMKATLPFYYVISGGVYELVYEATYSNLGNTTLPTLK